MERAFLSYTTALPPVNKILKDAKPSNLPVEEAMINLSTALRRMS
jgi:hypothetical protein